MRIPVAKGVFVRVILAGLLAAILGASVLAQSPTGSIVGIVFDADARAIPGAEIIVVNDLTRVQYETKTNDVGIYAVPNLPPGPYRIQASKVGFKTLIKPDVILNVQDAVTINFTLPVGATSIAVTVEGGAPIVNTTDASVSTVVDRQFAENLPMNGRSFQSLIQLTPGVVVVAPNVSDTGQFSVNGQRAGSNYWMVDGVSANIGVGTSVYPGNGLSGASASFSALGGTNSLVSVDALQEFRIQTSTFAPEFGRTPGGQISIVTRSGTNDFHGTAFDYVRNDIFDANNWFANSFDLPKPRERQNDFGGTFAGPIRKDKTFFFFSYEGLRLRLPQTTLTDVPDVAARKNAIPATQQFLNAFPLPNGAAAGAAQFNASYSNPASLDAYSLRADRVFSKKFNLFARYNYSPSQLVERGGGSPLLPLSDISDAKITTQTGTIGLTWSISSDLVNDLRFNYSQTSGRSLEFMDGFGGAVPLTAAPFPGGFTVQDSQFLFQIESLNGGDIFLGKNSYNVQRQVNVVENLSWQEGAHSLKFGADIRRLAPMSDPRRYGQSAFFSDVASAESGTLSFSTVDSFADATLLFRNVGLFAQDTWRANRRLTLTYGLRWDVDFTPSSTRGPNIAAVTGFNLADLSDLMVAQPGKEPFSTRFGNLAPRIGLAYSVRQIANWKTVVRGGFGVFYDLATSEAGNFTNGGYPFFAESFQSGGNFPLDAAAGAPPSITPEGLAGSTLYAFDPKLNLPYTLEWNVSLEQGVGTQQRISATYVGASGRRLLQTAYVLAPNPNIGAANLVSNTANSNYNALQIQFQRNLLNGLQLLASYSFSHSIDDSSAGSAGSFSNTYVPAAGAEANRGSSDFDIRHSFTSGLTYDLPTPKLGMFAKTALGGWSLQTVVLTRSAAPLNLYFGQFFELFNGLSEVRPDIVSGQPMYLYGSQYPGGKALNPGAFTSPTTDPATGLPLRNGDLGRNALRGFGASQWDFSVHRDFRIREKLKLQFRAEMFNLLNHPNFGPPATDLSNPKFGRSTQILSQFLGGNNVGNGGFDPLYQLGGPRSIQLALKLLF